jgi:hypothetical protein
MRMALNLIKNLLYIALIAWCLWYALLYIIPGFLQYIIFPVFVIWVLSKLISAIFDDKEKKYKNKNNSEQNHHDYHRHSEHKTSTVFDTEFEEDKEK